MANGRLAIKSAAKSGVTKKDSFVKTSIKRFVDQGSYNQRVQQKAYELYLQRGGFHGNDWSDWFEAERIISSGSK